VQAYVPCIVQRLFLVVFSARQYVLHCVYSSLSVDLFNKDYHHHDYNRAYYNCKYYRNMNTEYKMTK